MHHGKRHQGFDAGEMDGAAAPVKGIEPRKFYRETVDALREAVRIEVRYNTKDHNGQTRGERNRLAGAPVPPVTVPEAGAMLWGDFWKVCAFRHERERLSPRQMAEYAAFHGIRWQRWQMKALAAMDQSFCNTLAEETRLNEERRAASNATRGKGALR